METFPNIELYRATARKRAQHQVAIREAHRQQALTQIRKVAPFVIAAFPNVEVAYLFGSVLRNGAFRPDSDIDIALDGDVGADYFPMWSALEEALPNYAIDLRELPANGTFSHKVRLLGEKLYERQLPNLTSRN